MKNSKEKEFFKQKIFYVLTSPLFYLLTLFENLFLFASFFLSGTFFSASQSYPLLSLFSILPLLSSIVIPVISISISESFDNFLPFSRQSLVIQKALQVTFLYTISLIPLFLVPLSINFFTSLDFNAFLLSFFFIIIYAFLSVSVCLFFESIFEKKIAAFFISFAFLILFATSSLAFENISENIFVKVIKYFSFSRHFNSSSKGIFDSRDFVFFIAASLFFLFLSDYAFCKKNGKNFEKSEKITKFLTFSILILSILLSGRYYFRLDFTSQKNYSLSSYTKKLIRECQDTIEINYYRSSGLENLYPSAREINEFLLEYNNFSNVKVKFFDSDKKENQEILLSNNIIPKSIERRIKGKTEYVDIYSAIIIEYSGKSRIIPFTLTAKNLEYLIDEKLCLIKENQERRVLILPSYSEASSQAYDYLESFLTSLGFNPLIYKSGDISEWILQNKSSQSLLLVLGSEDFDGKAVEEIETFMEEGHPAFFALSPFKKDAEASWEISKISSRKLINLIETYGFRFSDKIVNDISSSRVLMEDDSSYSKLLNYSQWPQILPQEGAKNGMVLFWPVALEKGQAIEGEIIQDLLYTSDYSWREEKLEKTERLFETNPFVLENRKLPEKNSLKKELVALRHSGSAYGFYNPEIFSSVNFTIISDQNFLDSLLLGYASTSGTDFRNLDFLAKELLYLNNEKELSMLYEKSLNFYSGFYKIKDDESFIKYQRLVFIINFGLFPLFILMIFISMRILRKRKIQSLKKELSL